MLKAELAEIIQNGESSGVEFKRDDVHPDSLAKEIAARANLEGGRIILGIEDNGAVSGLTKAPTVVEQWVMNLCRENLQPAMIPYWEIIQWEEGRQIGVITIPADAPDKPYRAKRGGAWITYVRVGSTSREASREEEVRLFQASGLVRYDLRPVPGATINDLDRDFYQSYFKDVLRDYEYVESRGMGVLEKIIAGMRAHNGTEPDLIEEESRFVVRLWKNVPIKKN